ncbi:MAG TPA: ATP-binding protein, partial [Chthoniobacteraceae bacterium]|nr:ATP-binding protein [Chthoniobacteraceae bacterium]
SKTLEGIITTWNKGAQKMFGYSAQEAVGKPVTILIPPDHLDEEPRILERVRSGQVVLPYETVRMRKDGSLLNVSLTVSPVKDSTGSIIGVSKIARDITQRKRAEAERAQLHALEQAARARAEEAERRARFLAEASAGLISTLDYQETLNAFVQTAVTRITDWCAVHLRDSDGVTRLAAAAHSDPAKQPTAVELRKRYPEPRDLLIGTTAVLRSGKPEVIHEITDEILVGAARDADHLALLRGLGLRSAIVVPLVANDRVFGAIALASGGARHRYTEADLPFAEDLAARVATAAENARLYQELRQANVAKDHFMAVLSHELRTPLNPVLMTVADLERDQSIAPAIREQLTVVRRNVELEARLIDDLLDSTRIASGKLQLQRTVVDATELIRRAIGIVESEAQAKGVRLELATCADPCPVDSDPARLQQVIWNVVKNAVKFTPKGGSVRVSSQISSGRIQIVVQDNGIGIEQKHLASIFNPFEQGDLATGRRFGGLGLGLAISKALVTLHGGSLTAQSDGPNRGATFTIDLPLATQSPTTIAAVPSETARRRPLRLLVVEDHEATANVMVRLLTKRGYLVSAASNISEALAVLQKSPIDLLISDVGLPDGSGRDLMEKVRETHDLPGIALSGYGTEADLEQSSAVGFSVHLTKPVDIERLDREIQTLAAKTVA